MSSSLRSLLSQIRPVAGWMALSALLGVLTVGSGIGLMTLSAYLISEAAHRFGSQCIVVAIDAKKSRNGGWQVHTYGGVGGGIAVELDAVEWAVRCAELGAGELLITGMDADGTENGYDLELTRAVSEAVTVPVIASGGAGKPEHLYDAIVEGKADAVLAASIFHFGTYRIREVKAYLAQRDIPVRP